MMDDSEIVAMLGRVIRHRDKHGWEHRHHSACFCNLPADEQIAARGMTREEWKAYGFAEPVVITPDDWEVDPP